MKARRGRSSESRTRTGCNKCRQRRVKCPEQKPICRPCQALGFVCSYERALKWQDVEVSDIGRDDVENITSPYAETWMFLHVSSHDFESSQSLSLGPDTDCPWADTGDDKTSSGIGAGFNCLSKLSIPAWLLPLNLSPEQSRLWVYFHEAIAPTCVLNPQLNPYQDVILRIAATTGNTSPLFSGIMAISANQLYILGDQSFHSSRWDYHRKALRSLRLETTKMEAGTLEPGSAAPILATVMALVFLDILSDCSPSWVVHASFARSLIQTYRKKCRNLDPDIEALFNFVGGYIVVHEVYAHTAWDASMYEPCGGPVTAMSDDSNLQTLTGCSTEFFQILSDINSLASDHADYLRIPCPDPTVLLELEQRRQSLERQLHAWAPDQYNDELDNAPESTVILETKRLTGLLHLYSRIDHLGPHDTCISTLASRILSLIDKLPTQTSTMIWPLFMVATLGLPVECDAERAFILEKLDALQRRRDMRYIRKARRIIEDVWKKRDFKESATRMGWDILRGVAQGERISLS